MMGDTTVRFCKICNHDTEHLQGNFKSYTDEETGELFFLNMTLKQSLKQVSQSFTQHVKEDADGMMNGAVVEEFAGGGLNWGFLFARVVRSLRCGDCGHLIKLSRLP